MNSATLPCTRIGAIMRKDLRLLWPLAAASAVLQGLLGLLQHRSTPFDIGLHRAIPVALVTLALVVSMALVIVITVQQDPLPGANQDWVVRPIRRRDLLLAKLLVVALFVHVPIFAIQILQGYSEGFQFGQILPAALLSNIEIALVFTLPVTAIAAMTRNVGEAFVGSLAVLVGIILAFLAIAAVHYGLTHFWSLNEPTGGAGVQWVWRSLSHLWLLAVTVTAVLLQYFRRGTLRARTLFVGGLLLFTLASYLPWRPAFALQEWLGPHAACPRVTIRSAAGQSVRVARIGRHEPAGLQQVIPQVLLTLPLRVSGLPARSMLHVDRAAVRLLGNGGAAYRGLGDTPDLQRFSGGGRAVLEQGFPLLKKIYRRLARGPVTARIDYSLTLFREQTLGMLPVPGDARVPELGRCADRLDPNGKVLEVACMTMGAEPPCIEIHLLPPSGAAQTFMRCGFDYAPAALRFSVNPLAHLQSQVRLAPGIAAALDGAPSVSGYRIQFLEYEPQAHFSRTVVISQLDLPAGPQVAAPAAAPSPPAIPQPQAPAGRS